VVHKLLDFLPGDPVLLEVAHVGQEHDLALGLLVLVDLLHPEFAQFLEGYLIVDLVYKDHSVGASVIC